MLKYVLYWLGNYICCIRCCCCFCCYYGSCCCCAQAFVMPKELVGNFYQRQQQSCSKFSLHTFESHQNITKKPFGIV